MYIMFFIYDYAVLQCSLNYAHELNNEQDLYFIEFEQINLYENI